MSGLRPPTAPALGPRLEQLRRQVPGLSAAALARAVGTTGQYLRAVERGRYRPSPGLVTALVQAISRRVEPGDGPDSVWVAAALILEAQQHGEVGVDRREPRRRRKRRRRVWREHERDQAARGTPPPGWQRTECYDPATGALTRRIVRRVEPAAQDPPRVRAVELDLDTVQWG